VGKAIKGRTRSDVIIATKTGARTPEEIRKHLDLSLKRLGTDYIDLYQFHQVSDTATIKKVLDPENGLLKVFEEAKKAGKILHIGASAHQMDAAKVLTASGRFETILPFNFITSEPPVNCCRCAVNMTWFIVMKPGRRHVERCRHRF
jgi:aryl-alcohol dehydrogenase-like predicted oxidoreductase